MSRRMYIPDRCMDTYYDFDKNTLYLEGNDTGEKLTCMQFKVLEYLAQNAGITRSKDNILTNTDREYAGVYDNCVKQNISEITQFFKKQGIIEPIIKNTRGLGYYCVFPIVEVTPEPEPLPPAEDVQKKAPEEPEKKLLPVSAQPEKTSPKKTIDIIASVDPVDSIDPIDLAQKMYQRILSRGRFIGYDEVKNKITSIRDVVEIGSVEMTLEDIIFNYPKYPENTHSVSLCGKGGSGKTHQFINLIRTILYGDKGRPNIADAKPKYPGVIPYYVELNDIKIDKGDNLILIALAAKMRTYKVTYRMLESILAENGSNVILFCDGMNEVTDEVLREKIARNICDLRELYHTRIVLSSRVDHTDLFNGLDLGQNRIFVNAKIKELTPAQINQYFNECGLTISYRDISEHTRKLLETAQGLSMYASMLSRKHTGIQELESLGMLLQCYCDWILKIDRTNGQPSDLEFEQYLSRTAYRMVLDGNFQLCRRELESYLGEDDYNKLINSKKARQVFSIQKKKNEYEFTHQNFRDLYASLYIVKQLEQIDSNNLETDLPVLLDHNRLKANDEILHLCADLIAKDEPQRIINLMKASPLRSDAYLLSVLIRIHAFAHDNSIADLDLKAKENGTSNEHALDLRNVSLSTYKLYERSGGKVRSVQLKGAYISADTFLQNGLQNGCSTVCRYTMNGIIYICAFSSANAQIYNTKNNTWKCVRYPNTKESKNGWINCCCVSETDGDPRVYLGCQNNTVNVFLPVNLSDTNFLQRLTEPVSKTAKGIESILCAADSNDNEVLVFSDTEGTVYVTAKETTGQPVVIHRMTAEQQENAARLFRMKGIDPACRLTASEEHLYLCFGAEIWHCPLPVSAHSEFSLLYRLEDSSLCIKDIMYSEEYLYLNLVDRIAAVTRIEGEYVLSEPEYYHAGTDAEEEARKESLRFFTKFSSYPDKTGQSRVMIGIKAKDDTDYVHFPNFHVISANSETEESEYGEKTFRVTWDKVFGRHRLATYTGAAFRVGEGDKLQIATVSDDRSVQIISPSEEDREIILHPGSYDGIHYIDVVDERMMLIATYDGSVSQWVKPKSQWCCRDVYHVHQHWVWKVQHFRRDGKLFFLSCSYDGKLVETDTKTGKSIVLLDLGLQQPILDFSVVTDANGRIRRIAAITKQNRLFWLDPKDTAESSDEDDTGEPDWRKKRRERVLRSIAAVPDGTVLFAESETEKGSGESDTKKGYVCALHQDTVTEESITIERNCHFIRTIKLFRCGQKTLMLVGGNRQDERNNKRRLFYLAVYLEKDDHTWEYCGSVYPDQENEYRVAFTSADEAVSQAEIQDFAEINDFCVRMLPAEDSEIRFLLGTAHKPMNGSRIALFEVKCTPKQTTFAYRFSEMVSAQPMSIAFTNNALIAGLLNGEALMVDTETRERNSFQTYANLNASISISVKGARFSEDEEDNKRLEADFHKDFSCYFSFD